MKINEVSKLTGVTVRTLHYYDEIGLLKPNEITDAGYRLYNDDSLTTLQQILFFRELDFSLGDIKEIMKNPNYDMQEAFQKHGELLIQKRDRLNGLIALTESILKGDENMSFKEFDMTEIEANKKRYAKEVEERWGNTDAYIESNKRTSSYDKQKWKTLSKEGADILKAFGESRHLAPGSVEIQALVKKWQDHITTYFYHCTNEILSCLGIMYIEDERFTENIDKNGKGTAKFISDAISIYCAK